MSSERLDAFLDTPWRQLTDADWAEARRDFPDDFALLAARIPDAAAEPRSPAHTALYIDLLRCYPRSLRYYQERADEARRRRANLEARVAARFY